MLPPGAVGVAQRSRARSARTRPIVRHVRTLAGARASLAILAAALASVLAASAAASGSNKPPPPPHGNPFTSSAVRAFLSTRGGEVTAALYDVRSRQLFTLNPGVHEDEASIAKVDIVATLLHEAGAPLEAPDADDATAAIEDSDNDAAQDLWQAAGGDPAIAAFNRAAGLTHTLLDPQGVWGHDETTAADQVRLLETLTTPNPLLPTSARRYELALMRNVSSAQAWGVSAGVLAPATVALKNGWLTPDNETGWQVNSIGVVRGRYRDYLLAVLTSGAPDMTYGVETIEGISRRVWRYLLPRRFRPRPTAGSAAAKLATRSTSAPSALTGART
jgi:beta-lactamase class A